MKIQLIILGLFVVATLAHRHEDGDDDNQIVRRRHFRGRRRNDNQIAADAEDAELEVDSIPSEPSEADTTEPTRRRGCGSRRGGRRGGSRRWEGKGGRRHEHDQDTDLQSRNDDDMSEGENQLHNPDWHAKHGVPMPGEKSDFGRRHHHHRHHHHHHHHHRNRTTTVPPTTSTTGANIELAYSE